MKKIESIKIDNFISKKSIIRKNNNTIVVFPMISGRINPVYIESIEPISGVYNIYLNVKSDMKLFWWGTYHGYQSFPLDNGINNFNINDFNP